MLGRLPLRLSTAGVVSLVLLARAESGSDEPVTGAAPYSGPVVRIFQKKCVPCHAAGKVAVPLATYQQVRPWARAIREEILERRMPPWPFALGSRPFANEIGLTVRERALMLSWVDGGTPRGDDKDLPLPPAAIPWPEGPPDVEIPLPEVPVAARAPLEVRTVTLPLKLPAVGWLIGIDYRPGDPRLVRSVFVHRVDSAGARAGWLGAWTPWYATTRFPPDTGHRLVPGSGVELVLPVQGVDEGAVERGTLGLYLAKAPPSRQLQDLAVVPSRASAAGPGYTPWRGARTVAADMQVWAFAVESGPTLPSLELVARRPDGSVDALLWIENPSGGWPTPFVFQDPVALPRGSTIEVVARAAPGDRVAPASRVVLSVFPAEASRTP